MRNRRQHQRMLEMMESQSFCFREYVCIIYDTYALLDEIAKIAGRKYRWSVNDCRLQVFGGNFSANRQTSIYFS